jgi:prepilin-type N-terminal cleavage/methylation domain-containing protein
LRRAFTLIELLAVIAIIGLIAALVGPTLANYRKGDAMLASGRNLLDAVARGRQLAISQHTTVYMVFLPPNYWTGFSAPWWASTDAAILRQRMVVTNLIDKQLTGYTYIALRSVGDQPGQGTVRYLTPWHNLPEGTFIADWKFGAANQQKLITNFIGSTLDNAEIYPVRGFDTFALPFPVEDSMYWMLLPCVAFNHLGQLVSTNGQILDHDVFIPLAHGTVGYAAKTRVLDPPTIQENPAGNSSNAFNLVHIDRFTGRARLERQEIR